MPATSSPTACAPMPSARWRWCRESMGHLWSELQTVGKKTPAAPTDQLERMRSAFEKVVAQVQELGQHMLEVQSQAMAVLNECATKNLEVLGTAAPELAALQQKAKSAFEHASQQTSAVIDEMKKRMATLEHETQGRGTPRPRQPSQPRRSRSRPRRRPQRPAAGQARAAPRCRADGQGRRPCRSCHGRKPTAARARKPARPPSPSRAEPAQPARRPGRRASRARRAIRYQPNGAKVWRPRKLHERADDDDRGDEGGERGHGDVEAERARRAGPSPCRGRAGWRPAWSGSPGRRRTRPRPCGRARAARRP